MIALFMDEDSQARALVQALRSSGFDVLTVNEAGRRGHSDESHLEFATLQGRTVVTANNGDYARLHWSWQTEGKAHAGIFLRPGRPVGAGTEVRAIEAAVAFHGSHLSNVMEYLNNWMDRQD